MGSYTSPAKQEPVVSNDLCNTTKLTDTKLVDIIFSATRRGFKCSVGAFFATVHFSAQQFGLPNCRA